jgi:hypothetical protein
MRILSLCKEARLRSKTKAKQALACLFYPGGGILGKRASDCRVDDPPARAIHITRWLGSGRNEDPYSYRSRYTMPKFIVNAVEMSFARYFLSDGRLVTCHGTENRSRSRWRT